MYLVSVNERGRMPLSEWGASLDKKKIKKEKGTCLLASGERA